MTLDELLRQLKAAHGDALLGVVVYGSTADEPAAKAGHNVLVVVSALDVAAMQADGAIAQAWHEAGNPVPLVLTEAEWRSSADVFAIEHADIADRHRVLHAGAGFAVTPRAAIRDGDIRRQLEYELLAQLISVRAAIAAAGQDVGSQRAILRANASRAVALMRAALRLSGRTPGKTPDAVCTEAAALAGFDAAPFHAALRQRRGTDIPKADVPSVLGQVHAGLARLVAYVDALPGA